MSNEAAPASSLTDKEREAIAQMPYEEARDKLIQAVQALEAGGLRRWPSARRACLARSEPSSTPRRQSRPPRPTPQARKTIWPEHPSRHSRSPHLRTFHRNVRQTA